MRVNYVAIRHFISLCTTCFYLYYEVGVGVGAGIGIGLGAISSFQNAPRSFT